jgi:hypothetical protein
MQEAFYTNSYPADKDANRFLVKLVKLFSLLIAGSDSYVIYSLACHLYTYVTTIHREPDTVLIACGVYVLGLTLRAVLAGLGYNFANTHTDRTPENFKSLFKFMHIVLAYNGLTGFAAYKFFAYHTEQSTLAYGPMGVNTHASNMMECFMCTIKMQMIATVVYYFLYRNLYQKELSQPKIVDVNAHSIKYYAKKTVTN